MKEMKEEKLEKSGYNTNAYNCIPENVVKIIENLVKQLKEIFPDFLGVAIKEDDTLLIIPDSNHVRGLRIKSFVYSRIPSTEETMVVHVAKLSNIMQRSSAAAQGAKVSFNELLTATTAIQERTACDGNIIGNSLKSIFRRLQRYKTREILEKIGVTTTNPNGELRNVFSILNDYASIYNSLTYKQRCYIDEQIAGLHQINILRAFIKGIKIGGICKENNSKKPFYKLVFESGIPDLYLPKNYTLHDVISFVSDEECFKIEIVWLTQEEFSQLPEWTP